ncbi:hypothetical protein Droror1_Dr00011962 [Drosera rotundifolia]
MPPQQVKLIVDTGSDLTRMNCSFTENLKEIAGGDRAEKAFIVLNDHLHSRRLRVNQALCCRALVRFSLMHCPHLHILVTIDTGVPMHSLSLSLSLSGFFFFLVPSN